MDDSSFQLVQANGSGEGAKLVIRVRKHGASSKQHTASSNRRSNGSNEEKKNNEGGKLNVPFPPTPSPPPPPPPRNTTATEALGGAPNKFKSKHKFKNDRLQGKNAAKKSRGIFKSILKLMKRNRKKPKQNENKIDSRRTQPAQAGVQSKIDLFERNCVKSSKSGKIDATGLKSMMTVDNVKTQNRGGNLQQVSSENQKDQLHGTQLHHIASTSRPPPPPPPRPRRHVANSSKITGGAETFSRDKALISKKRNIASKLDKFQRTDTNPSASSVSKRQPQWGKNKNAEQWTKGTSNKTSHTAGTKITDPTKKSTPRIPQSKSKTMKCSLSTSVLADIKTPTKNSLKSTSKNRTNVYSTNGSDTSKEKSNIKGSNARTSMYSRIRAVDHAERKSIAPKSFKNLKNKSSKSPCIPGKSAITKAFNSEHTVKKKTAPSSNPSLSDHDEERSKLDNTPICTIKSQDQKVFSCCIEDENSANNKQKENSMSDSPCSPRRRRGSSFVKALSIGAKKLTKAPMNASPLDMKTTLLSAIKGGGHKLKKMTSDKGIGINHQSKASGDMKVEKQDSKGGLGGLTNILARRKLMDNVTHSDSIDSESDWG